MNEAKSKLKEFDEHLERQFGPIIDFECDTHGTYQARRDLGGCPECTKEIDRQKRLEEESERQERILANRWASCGMPEKFCGITLDDWIADTPKKKATKTNAEYFISGAFKHWLLIGNCGTGKTMLAAAIIGEMAKNGKHPHYITATRMVRRIRDSWKLRGTSEQEVLDEFIKAQVLVIDELGAGRCTEDDRVIVSEIVCDRYSSNSPTILISNLTADDIKSHVLDERAIDRIREGKVSALDGESMRGANGSA